MFKWNGLNIKCLREKRRQKYSAIINMYSVIINCSEVSRKNKGGEGGVLYKTEIR